MTIITPNEIKKRKLANPKLHSIKMNKYCFLLI